MYGLPSSASPATACLDSLSFVSISISVANRLGRRLASSQLQVRAIIVQECAEVHNWPGFELWVCRVCERGNEVQKRLSIFVEMFPSLV